jgi:hypothetical protein
MSLWREMFLKTFLNQMCCRCKRSTHFVTEIAVCQHILSTFSFWIRYLVEPAGTLNISAKWWSGHHWLPWCQTVFWSLRLCLEWLECHQSGLSSTLLQCRYISKINNIESIRYPFPCNGFNRYFTNPVLIVLVDSHNQDTVCLPSQYVFSQSL